MKRLLLSICIISLEACTASHSAAPPAALPAEWQIAGISPDDARNVMHEALELAVVQRRISGLHSLADPKRIPILEDNAAPVPLPVFGDVGFFYASREELQKLADTRGDHLFYFRVRNLRRQGEKIVMDLDNIAVTATGRPERPHGSGMVVELTKGADGWRADTHQFWIE